MIKILITVVMITLSSGCGGSSSSTKDIESTNRIQSSLSGYHIAKDSLLHNVEKNFGEYKLKVLTDKVLGEDEISNDYISVYGLVDDKNTKSLLVLNSNYPKGTKVAVEVYKGNQLIKTSKPTTINSDVVNFGSIKTN